MIGGAVPASQKKNLYFKTTFMTHCDGHIALCGCPTSLSMYMPLVRIDIFHSRNNALTHTHTHILSPNNIASPLTIAPPPRNVFCMDSKPFRTAQKHIAHQSSTTSSKTRCEHTHNCATHINASG